MKHLLPVLFVVLADAPVPSQALRPVPFHEVEITDRFWSKRIEVNRRVTVPHCLDRCESTGRLQNLRITGGLAEGKFRGRLYDDSDVYKVIEGAAYALHDRRDPDLEKRVDEIIDAIAAAQGEDGYVSSYYTLVKPDQRWKNTAHGHELYCAGHMIEAAIAYWRATGKDKLLGVAVRFADLIDREFGPGRRLDPPGHQELELALFKLAKAKSEPRYAKLARFFLETRGDEARGRLYGEYCQDHVPVREQTEPVGHAVRAMYLYSAMTDMVALTGDAKIRAALEAIWNNLASGKMYVTGGIGASASNEGFTQAYHLPNDSAYAETCAAIGMALWNHRMFLLTGDKKYVDVLERVLYNGLLSGVSLSGDRFFYTNRLGSRGKDERRAWFGTACCPSNVVRFVPAIGERIWAHDAKTIYALLFIGSKTTIRLDGRPVAVALEGDYPWKGRLRIRVDPETEGEFTLALRMPDWCRRPPQVTLNAATWEAKVTDGFVRLSRTWRKGDRVQLDFAMPVRRIEADPRVRANKGRVVLARGPLVYCFEGADNDGRVRNLILASQQDPGDFELVSDAALGVLKIRTLAHAVTKKDGAIVLATAHHDAIPYFAWCNRGPGEMVVWIPAGRVDLAEIPGEPPFELVGGVKLRASHCWGGDTVTALRDGKAPKSSNDHAIPRLTWWGHKGTKEWASCEFPEPRRIAWTEVYWFDDEPRGGGCRTPESWRLLYKEGEEWKPVTVKAGAHDTSKDRFCRIEHDPVETKALRLEVKLRAGFSGGVLEWRTGGPE